MSSEFIIAIILFIYIGFLHYQLHRKSVFIESLMERQKSLDLFFSREGIDEFLMKVKGVGIDTYKKHNKLFENEIQNFILEGDEVLNLFIHYTKDHDVAQKIIDEGFRFVETFYKTAEPISNDRLDFIYKHYLHKYYGKYVIIIGISKDLYSKYLDQITKTEKVINVEQIISQKLPFTNENEDDLFILPKQFIKGYINSETGEIIHNNAFEPSFDSPIFSENIKNL